MNEENNVQTKNEFSQDQTEVLSESADLEITEETTSNKSRVVAAVLNFFLGAFGIHRFYLGKIGTGILMLLLTIVSAVTAFFFVGYFILAIEAIWEVVDFFRIVFGRMKDSQGKWVK